MSSFAPFKLERYFAQYEFKARYLLSASDCESLSLAELLELSDPATRRLWEALSLGYTETQGHPALRAEIAQLYDRLAAENVLVLTPEEGIFIALHTLVEPGDHVVAVAPAYQSLAEIARGRGCAVTPWTLRPQAGRWTLNLQELADAFTPRTKLLVLNFPNNPTGYLPAPVEFEAILELAQARGVYVFADEMYRWLEPDPDRRLTVACDLYERAITLSGVSKSLALPGLRIGWLATRAPGLMERWLAFKDYTTICHSAPSEILALMALRARAVLIERSLGIVQANRLHAQAFCSDHADLFEWLAPDAGSIAFPRWTGPGTVEGFCQALVDAHGVMAAPGSLFDYPGHLRIGLGRRNLPAALAQVDAYLRLAGLA